MKNTPMSLRSSFSTALVGLGALALTAAVSLMVLTSLLHDSAKRLRGAVEKVQDAQELRVNLLQRERARDLAERNRLEVAFSQDLEAIRRYVITPTGRERLALVDREVAAYVAARHAADHDPAVAPAAAAQLDRTLVALDGLVQLNLSQSEESLRHAARWDELGDVIGATVVYLFAVGSVGLVVWLRRRMVAPVMEVGAAMDRFAGGEPGARVPERGPVELRQMARRFNDMAGALEHKRDEQLTFLAGVAHDQRNLLAALKLTAQLAARQPGGGSPARTAQLLRLVDRLERMVGDLLEATRIEAGYLELRREPVDVATLVRDVEQQFDGSSANHTIRLVLPVDPLVAHWDPARVEQVLSNLLSNAIKYSPDGGEVVVTVERAQDTAVISVADHGVGIALDQQPRLFEAFHRVAGARISVPGVGLGLAVSRRIVESHGGRIEVDSRPDAGSVFRVYLPLDPAGALAAAAPDPAVAPPAGSRLM